MIDYYEKVLYTLALKALKNDEIPVAAIIVKNGKIISRAYNKRRSKSNPLLHAEVQAIVKASKKIKDWRLSGCEMYVTLEPCHMCKEVIKESRIEKVYYFSINKKIINYKTDFKFLNNNFSIKCEKLLTTFFKKLR